MASVVGWANLFPVHIHHKTQTSSLSSVVVFQSYSFVTLEDVNFAIDQIISYLFSF